MKMWKMLYFITVVGVFLQTSNGQPWDIKKMEQCPCANEIIEGFLASVAKNAVEVDNGQKLRLRLWQLNNDDCTVNVVDKSPKPGIIEISMAYRGSVAVEEQSEGQEMEDQYKSDDEQQQQQQERVDVGQDKNEDSQSQLRSVAPEYQQGAVDIGQQQEDEDNGQQQAAEDIGLQQAVDNEQLLENIALDQVQQSADMDQLQQDVDIEQEQAGVDIAQELSELSSDSHLETEGDKKDYSTEYGFIMDVNTGTLFDSADSVTRTRRRKREIMPFEKVVFKITIDLAQKPDSDDGTINDQIKSLLKIGLGDYWLAMAFCYLDVQQ